MYPDLNMSLSCIALLMNIIQSFVTLYQKGKSFQAVGKSMQDSPTITLNNAQHGRIRIIRVSYFGEKMFQKLKIAKFIFLVFCHFCTEARLELDFLDD